MLTDWRVTAAAAIFCTGVLFTCIETNAQGRTTGVAYFDARHRERFQKAREVVVCANGAETQRLLLI